MKPIQRSMVPPPGRPDPVPLVTRMGELRRRRRSSKPVAPAAPPAEQPKPEPKPR